MKRSIKYVIKLLCSLIIFHFTGCILDAFETLTQEIPYTFNINVSGSGTSIVRSAVINLDDNNFYADKQNKIKQIKLVKIAYKTKSVDPSDLQGNVSISAYQSDGTIIFSKNIPGAQPSAYFVNPYQLNLSEAELQAANQYFGELTNKQFTVSIKIDNLTSGTKTLNAEIFTVFEIEYDLK
jgi:hypothetical protein